MSAISSLLGSLNMAYRVQHWLCVSIRLLVCDISEILTYMFLLLPKTVPPPIAPGMRCSSITSEIHNSVLYFWYTSQTVASITFTFWCLSETSDIP
jgi:hypothetical protein